MSGILAFFSAKKNAAFGISAEIINMVNIFFLSPSLTVPIALVKKKVRDDHVANNEALFTILVLIQIVAIIFIAVQKYRQKKGND
ncbi:MAG: hypothetical protein ACTFAL_12440 [Candidatus Electronema sp. V4]|uniref:hypothetical protein n=1 Tax=Candidatus Electronema sp. V4 TaxID=3454756 RepID=UPI0040556A83